MTSAVVTDQRILVGTVATVSAQFLDQDGEPAAPTGPVLVVAVSADGTEFLASTAATHVEDGLYEVALPQTSALDWLTLTWTATNAVITTTVEVVSRFYTSSKQVKAHDKSLVSLNLEDKYDTARVHRARHAVEVEFERLAGRAFVPRFARVRLRGGSVVVLPHVDIHRDTVELSTIDPTTGDLTAVTVPFDLDAENGMLYGVMWSGDLLATYTHGMQAPPPDVIDVFYMRIRDVMNRPNTGVPARTSTFSSELGGTYSLLVPGRAGVMTGIPDVDELLAKYHPDRVLVG